MKLKGFGFGFWAKWSGALARIGERLRSQRRKKMKEAGPPPPERPQPTPFRDKKRTGRGVSGSVRGKGAFGKPRSPLIIPLVLLLSVLGGAFFFKGRVPEGTPASPPQGPPPPFQEGQAPRPPLVPDVPAAPSGGGGEDTREETPPIAYGIEVPAPSAPPVPSASPSFPGELSSLAPAPGGPASPPPVSGATSAPFPVPSPAGLPPNPATAPRESPQGPGPSTGLTRAREGSEPSEALREASRNSLTALLTPDLFPKPPAKRERSAEEALVAVPPPIPPALPPLPPPPQPAPPPAPARAVLPVPPKVAGVVKGDGKVWVLLETASGVAEVEVAKDTFQRWRFELRRGEVYAVTEAPASEDGKEARTSSQREVAYRLVQTESGFAWNLQGGKP